MNDWDFAVFLDVDFDVAVERASQRDWALFGSVEEARDRYWKRYVSGQRLYLGACRPQEHADVVIDNNDWMNPRIINCSTLSISPGITDSFHQTGQNWVWN